MPEHKRGYPPNWPDIAYRIKEQAAWHCERCGHPNDSTTGHVLTVHHLDSDKGNCADENLAALCQRCHLHIQAIYIAGQLPMPGCGEDWLLSKLQITV